MARLFAATLALLLVLGSAAPSSLVGDKRRLRESLTTRVHVAVAATADARRAVSGDVHTSATAMAVGRSLMGVETGAGGTTTAEIGAKGQADCKK